MSLQTVTLVVRGALRKVLNHFCSFTLLGWVSPFVDVRINRTGLLLGQSWYCLRQLGWDMFLLVRR